MTSVYIPRLSRRDSLKALAAAGVSATGGVSQALAQPAELKDEDIFQFALNLEYMEAEYYLRATTGKGIDAADAGSDPGGIKGGARSISRAKQSGSSQTSWRRTSLRTSGSTARRWATRPSAGRQSTSKPVSKQQPRAPGCRSSIRSPMT
jgi:Ferritin-like domain